MANWISLPQEPLFFNPYQDAFWKAHRGRVCKACKIDYDCPPDNACPNCHQKGERKFHRLTLLAGRRGGKTRAAAIAAAEEACVPNTIGWCCAPTNPKLHRYVIPAMQQLISPDWVVPGGWSSEFLDLRLRNGSLIHFQTLEDPDQGRGQGLDWVWLDEVCELTEKHWLVLRPSLTERRGVALFSSSPRSYDWVWKNFYHKAEEGSPGFWACQYKTSENPIISDEEVAEARATMPDAMFRQEYEADFVIFEGAVYGEHLKPSHILQTTDAVRAVIPEWPEIDGWRQRIVGIDTGADHPFGAVKLVSTEKGLVVVGEYLERNKSFVEHANALKRLAGSSSAKWAINKNEKQPCIELAQHGIYCQKAENDQVSGIERVKTWLHNDQLWFVESLCPRTITQMKAYRWAENTSRDGQVKAKERVYKKEDELPDCVRYAVMTWPELPKTPVATEQRRDISKLPDEMRGAIERMRRMDASYTEKPSGIVGDFWQ